MIKVLLLILSLFCGDVFGSGVSSTSNYNPSAVAITGGVINNTTVGLTTPKAGTFTLLTATSGLKSVGGQAYDYTTSNTMLGSDKLAFIDSTRTANNKYHEFGWASGIFYGRFVNDTYSAAVAWLTISGGYAGGISYITMPLLNVQGAFSAGALDSTPIGATTPSTGKFTTANVTSSYSLNGVIVASATAPTYSAGCVSGGPAVIEKANGTAAFVFNYLPCTTVGNNYTVTLPTAPTGWHCAVSQYQSTVANVAFVQIASTTTSANIQSYNPSTGTTVNLPTTGTNRALMFCTAY